MLKQFYYFFGNITKINNFKYFYNLQIIKHIIKHIIMIYMIYVSIVQIVVIKIILKLHDLLLDLTIIDPSNMIFHIPSDKHSRIRDYLRPQPQMTLLDESSRLLHTFHKLQTLQHYTEPPSTEITNWYFLGYCQILFISNETHTV